MPIPATRWLGTTPRQLRAAIQNDAGRLHRAAAAATLPQIGAMMLTTLLQMAAARNLLDHGERATPT